MKHAARSILMLAAVVALGAGGVAPAQTVTTGAGASRAISPRLDNYNRMLKPVTIELTDQRLGDVMTFIRDLTGADIDAIWGDERIDGLDKEKRVTLSVREKPVLALLERVLDKSTDNAGDATWQFTPEGAIEVGLKSSLNKHATLRLYPIQDLLFEIPSFSQVPQLDLNSVLSQGGSAGAGGGGGGGGGGGSLFSDQGQNQNGENGPLNQNEAAQAQRIINLIIETVEPTQWQDNGGDGASIRFYNGNLMIKAPEYIHRQIAGGIGGR